MTMWILYPLLGTTLYAITNIIEKYVVDKHVKDTNTLVILGGVINFVIGIILFIALGFPLIPIESAFLIILAGVFLIIYLIPYFKALAHEDASTVVPLFAFAPIISLILAAVFFKEILLPKQVLGFIIILIGGLMLSIKGEGSGLSWIKPRKVFWLMNQLPPPKVMVCL